MPKFRIIGADRDTGEDCELVIDAADVVAAQERARQKGILVSECLVINDPHNAYVLPPQFNSNSAHSARAVAENLAPKAALPNHATVIWGGPPLPSQQQLSRKPAISASESISDDRRTVAKDYYRPLGIGSRRIAWFVVAVGLVACGLSCLQLASGHFTTTDIQFQLGVGIFCVIYGMFADQMLAKSGRGKEPRTAKPKKRKKDSGAKTPLKVWLQAAVLTVICSGGGIWYAANYIPESPRNPRQVLSPSPAPAVSLPTIHVTDDYNGSEVSFQNWRMDGVGELKGAMTWKGTLKIDEIKYIVRADGLIKDQGDLWTPGQELTANEAMEVTVPIMDNISGSNDPSKYDITIEVKY